MKKALIVIGITLVVLLGLSLGAYALIMNKARQGLAALAYEPADMQRIADGTYEGTADAGLVFVRLTVTVKDHALQAIDILEHRNGRGAKAEAITQEMIAQNRYDVDVVSGATLSSKTIQSAVSQALAKGEK